jgi:hypothetical protein
LEDDAGKPQDDPLELEDNGRAHHAWPASQSRPPKTTLRDAKSRLPLTLCGLRLGVGNDGQM